jgi:hypothetical protein
MLALACFISLFHNGGIRNHQGDAMTDQTKTVSLALELTDAEAWNLAQFLKRVGFADFRSNAQDEAEAYAMRDAADRVAVALREAGYAPR